MREELKPTTVEMSPQNPFFFFKRTALTNEDLFFQTFFFQDFCRFAAVLLLHRLKSSLSLGPASFCDENQAPTPTSERISTHLSLFQPT